ncbi:MAG: phosphocholine cytidylyltransferase family protein [Candidatus Marinimicrobia bacterium]|jgi:choline kinase|nr:phosphocholine cytidylyltransferase family protein [Candidatus Neomarinimicrobiota bacterium]MDP6593547.1 phosphocholine cytidylyltransferase family protein [Candidatus Neomarinimicrobiota bacterium]MDP6837027.1 phosphocholine cytidylyltransferase family protein [Candidatus Neomarinimicrobiota bacterium]MDP6966070.1 phosphocholine cytidylyltransferase family protein [Candidatus Neomarinimicrobiota bacterium]|tara:strand:- start:900 stop:1637 length:738 start_codon:yes stop_codon:yes gene_type:complete
MKAVILAAGVARRLYPVTLEIPKCLLAVGDHPIIDYQLSSLQSSGVTDVAVVVGYFRGKVEEYLKNSFPALDFTFIINEHFFETNTSYSLFLASEYMVNTEIILMNGDVLYPSELLRRVIDSDAANVLAVEVKPCGREEVKIIEGENNRVVAIGKELIQENALGEFIGVAKLSSEFSSRLVTSLDHLIGAGGKVDYFEAAIELLLSETEVFYENVSDLPCIEIDFAEDLEKAEKLAGSDWFRNQF